MENSASKKDDRQDSGLLVDMKFARKFSSRNGFGKHVMPAPYSLNDNEDESNFRELHKLLSNFNSAEEAAIRRIAPMMSIIKLSHGNIGSKGNTRCAHIDSKLATILLNLPDECRYIVVQRTRRGGGIKNTKYKRDNIERALLF